MEYNSSREELIIPEYGRHVQNMVRHARTIENPQERQQFIETIVSLIMQMHPQNRNLDDYRDKMWKHVFRIAEYNLEVLPPNGVIPKPEDRRKRPDRVPYPSIDTRFRHYGHNVQKLIAKAVEMKNGPKKDGFVQVIGSYMKLAYRTWNREHFVSDEIIIEDLENLSGGKLKLVDDISLDSLARANAKKSPNSVSNSFNNNNSSNTSRGGSRSARGDRDQSRTNGRNRRSNSGGSSRRRRK